MSDTSFENQVQERKDEMIEVLEAITLDDIKDGGLSLNFAGKTFKFKDMEVVADDDLEDIIRGEFRAKLNAQQQRIREKINTKINQLLTMHQQKQNELERKERQLQQKYNNSAMMPDITYDHAKRGLMVVKNEGIHDELLWLFRGKYVVKFFKKSRAKKPKAIKKDLRRRLIKDIILRIKTKGNQIIEVSTHNPDANMSAFWHYHKMSSESDCWGNWKYPQTWSTPQDIILCAKDALAVLETINEGSVAKDNPSGLPRIETVRNHLSTMNVEFEDAIQGESEDLDDEDVWSTT
jgi:hypothetical protein